MGQWQPAHRKAVGREQGGHAPRQPCQGLGILFRIAGADISMHKGGPMPRECRCGFGDFTKDQITRGRDRGGMRGTGAIKGDDAAVGKAFAQVVIGAPVAKADRAPVPLAGALRSGLKEVPPRRPTDVTAAKARRG